MSFWKKTKQVAEGIKDTGVADVAVTTIPERMIIDGPEKARDDTFKAIDKADASDKKATGYKDQ